MLKISFSTLKSKIQNSYDSMIFYQYRVHEGDDLNNTHAAERGEWWQGLLVP